MRGGEVSEQWRGWLPYWGFCSKKVRTSVKKHRQESHFEKSRAERVGFEPTVPCGTTVFKTAAFNHSATSPIYSLFQSSYCRTPYQSRTVAECSPPRSASDKKQSSLLSSHLASLRIKHKAVYVLSTQPPLQYIRFFKAHIVALLISRAIRLFYSKESLSSLGTLLFFAIRNI